MATSADKLLEIVNTINEPQRLLTQKNVVLGEISPNIDSEFNTSVRIAAVPGRGYINDVVVNYQRLVLSDIVPHTSALRTVVSLTPELVVQTINQAYDLFLSVDDLQPFDPPILDQTNHEVTFTITAKSDSVGFVGAVELVFQYGKAYLDGVISVRKLPVLRHPVSQLKVSAHMLLWSKDFTSIWDAIQVDPKTRTYADWSTVQKVASFYGVPAWPQGYISDQATKDVPDANPAFDRVVIQSAVPGGMDGAIYLHYNVMT